MFRRIQNHRALLVLAAAFLLLALAAGGCKRSTQPAKPAQGSSPVTAGNKLLGKYEWTLQNKQRAKVADYLGKVIVVDFYATWCEPCRRETPQLVQLQKQYAPQGLQVIGLNVGGDDDRAEVPTYAKEFDIQYPLGYPDDALVDAYLSESENIPQTFVFDRSGNLIKHFVGYDDEAGQELDHLLQTLLTQSQATVWKPDRTDN
jgi:thiol-disulfide isomerase/thioredoxin